MGSRANLQFSSGLSYLIEAHRGFSIRDCGNHGRQGKLVEHSRVATAVPEQLSNCGGFKDLSARTGSIEMVLQIELRFILREPLEVVAHQDSFLQGSQTGPPQDVVEIRTTGQDESERRPGIEVTIREEAKLLKAILAHELNLIDDDNETLVRRRTRFYELLT